MNTITAIVISILTSVPVAVLKIILSKGLICRFLGGIIYIGILLTSFFVMLTNAALMGVEKSNEWTYAYLSSFFIDVFFF